MTIVQRFLQGSGQLASKPVAETRGVLLPFLCLRGKAGMPLFPFLRLRGKVGTPLFPFLRLRGKAGMGETRRDAR
jgi:hypothetical protein